MKVGTEDKKKLILAGVFGVVAIGCLGYLYTQFFGGPSTPPPPPAPAVVAAKAAPVAARTGSTGAGPSATKVGSMNGQLDPTLHMEGMEAAESLEYSGTGRNIFAPGPQQAPAPTPVIEKVKFPIHPGPQAPIGAPPVAGPPPINLKFFGVATQDGVKRALLLSGDDVFLASPGEIVQRRYKIVTIAANSITVEDMPNSNKQTLPLVAN
jgi:hypothetical protein